MYYNEYFMTHERSSISLAVIGDIAFDNKITSTTKTTTIGGGAFGSAVGASLVNKDTGIVAVVGGDFNWRHITQLGVDTTGVRVEANAETAHFTLRMTNGGRSVVAVTDLIDKVSTNTFPSEYSNSRYLHLATSHPSKYLEWIAWMHQGGIRGLISVDAFELYASILTQQTIDAILLADMVFLNDAEYACLLLDLVNLGKSVILTVLP